MLPADLPPGSRLKEDAARRLIEAVLPAARARAQMLSDLRAALEQGDERAAIAIARRYTGLPPLEVTP